MKCPYCNIDHDRRKWCSNNCKQEAYKQGKREANKKLLGHPCEQCQQPVMRHKARFCSDPCKIEYFKSEFRKNTATVRAATIRTCPVCEKDFNPKKTLKEIYCSKRCRCLFPKKCYKALQSCLEYMGEKKRFQTRKILGYTPDDLQRHIQGHPNWPTVKDGTWHLDHIFPIIAFLKHGIKDISVICCLENLQPLSEKANCAKNDDYNQTEFTEFLLGMGINIA